jgi:hypothetical protein
LRKRKPEFVGERFSWKPEQSSIVAKNNCTRSCAVTTENGFVNTNCRNRQKSELEKGRTERIMSSAQKSDDSSGDPTPEDLRECTLEEFFLDAPPGSLRAIKAESLEWEPVGAFGGASSGLISASTERVARYSTPLPELKLSCLSEKCAGPSWFRPVHPYHTNLVIELEIGGSEDRFLRYRCKSCEQSLKIYAVRFKLPAQGKLLAYKFGERPNYGPLLPAKVLRLVQSDAELFKKGWNAEKLNFGIAAFSYYRRIVENHKNELFDKIIEIAEQDPGFDPLKIQALRTAKNNPQFSQALDTIKDAIPDSLKIRGNNPLSLLYPPLSKGIHELSDEECLKKAQAIRTVLIALAERIAALRAQNRELKQAVADLSKPDQ